MRRLFKIMILGAVLVASACNNTTGGLSPDDGGDWIVDWAPVNVYILAQDNTGKSLISEDMPGMSVTFKGETYTVQPAPKAYLAIMEGLIAEKNHAGEYYLRFGEIDGAADMDEDIVLSWPDGTTDTIHYHCSDHKGGRNPSCNRTWKLNGQDHGGDIFVFIGKDIPVPKEEDKDKE